MDRTKYRNDRYVRSTRRSMAGRGGPGAEMGMGGAETAGGLASRAGEATWRREPVFETLERRQLLFSLTIPSESVNPETGIGQVRAYFGYTIPVLASNFDGPDETTTQTRVENFNDEPYGPIGTNQAFGDSALRIRHNILPAADIQVFAIPPTEDNQNRWATIRLNQIGEFFEWRFFADPQDPVVPIATRSASAAFRADSRDGTDRTGIDPNSVRITLLFDNQVVDTYQGAGQVLPLITGAQAANGVGTLTVQGRTPNAVFDTVRFELIAPYSLGGESAFEMDDVDYGVVNARFAQFQEQRIFGAAVVLTGPVGASASFFDLYGRAMRQTIALGIPTGAQVPLVDLGDTGIASFNDGIGLVRLSGTDTRTSMTIWGGTIQATDELSAGAEFFQDGFEFTLANLEGLYGDFERVGFGFGWDERNGQFRVTGLPVGPGSVIIGSPFVRPNTSPGAAGITGDARILPAADNIITTGFVRPDQGIQITDNGSIGSITVHGMVMGSSRFPATVGRLNFGYLLGSVSVEGDIEQIVSGTDAGQWSPDPGFNIIGETVEPFYKTSSLVSVGRTLGELFVGGRSLVDVNVLGDVNSPTTRPARNGLLYREREAILGIDPGTEEIAALRQVVYSVGNFAPSGLFRPVGQPIVVGLEIVRNDTLGTAEWISGASSAVNITGQLSGRDTFSGEDRADVYAFAVDGRSEIVVQATSGGVQYFRLVDDRGRTLAAPRGAQIEVDTRFSSFEVRYTPEVPGIIYLVVGDSANDDGSGNTEYSLIVTGMATATFGSYRTGGGSGFTNFGTGTGNSVSVFAGNMGSIRVGTGINDDVGNDESPNTTYNSVLSTDDAMSLQGGTFTIAGSLWAISAGSDIGVPGRISSARIEIRVGGDLGTLATGTAGFFRGSVGEGDLNDLTLIVGGRIGLIDVQGGVGFDQDETDPRGFDGGVTRISTGVNGGPGDIGFVRIGSHVGYDALQITTSDFSTIGGVIVSQDVYTDGDRRAGLFFGTTGMVLNTGQGSNIKFVDFPRADLGNVADLFFPIIGGRPVTFVDDGGALITIEVPDYPEGVQAGVVRAIPVNNSRGVVVAQITIDPVGVGLIGQYTLRVGTAEPTPPPGSTGTPRKAGTVGIGRVILQNANNWSFEASGNVEVDVYRLEHLSGSGMNRISNRTPDGDIVAADVVALVELEVDANLGSTELPTFGPRRIGPFLGLEPSLTEESRGSLGFPVATATTRLIDFDFNGSIERPIQDDNYDSGRAYLSDIGGPFDGYLNGLVVRTGSVTSVRSDGGIGDVILQGGDATLEFVGANANLSLTPGRFEGIFGNIFARDITLADIGQGLTRPGSGPLITSSIIAWDDLREVRSSTPNPALRGVVIAGDGIANEPQVDFINGLNGVEINSGTVDGAFIGGTFLDWHWQGVAYNNNGFFTAAIGEIRLNNTNLFRSTVFAGNLTRLNVVQGFFDASVVSVLNSVDTISAAGFRNSTAVGTTSEIRQNLIDVGRDVEVIEAVNGDISDLQVRVTGSVNRSIRAVNATRAAISVANIVREMAFSGDLKSSEVNVGELPRVTIGRNLVASTLSTAGRMRTVTVGGSAINANLSIIGPDAALETLTVANGYTGSISVTGPITTVTVTNGDLAGSLTTTTSRGNVGTIQAGRDVAIRSDIAGSVDRIVAGRHIGSLEQPGVVLVRGRLLEATATNGQLFSDLRVGGTIGAVTLGGAPSLPSDNQTGRGSIVASDRIGAVVIGGDFDGDIISYANGIGAITFNNASLLPNNRIAAFDGELTSVIINNGNLLGSVHADYDLRLLRVTARDAVFGNIGINPLRSPATAYDARRNQLPPGVVATARIDGPRITSGRDIVAIEVPDGFVFEAGFHAARALRNLTVGGTIGNDGITPGRGSFIAAGDLIGTVSVGGLFDTDLFAGLADLGADGRPGGTGLNADTVKQGSIQTINARLAGANSTAYAGITPGGNGIYGDSDDRIALGVSNVNEFILGGTPSNVAVRADNVSTAIRNDARIAKTGDALSSADSQLDPSATGTGGFSGTRTFDLGGPLGTITVALSGPGQGFFSFGVSDIPSVFTPRLVLRGTTSATNVTVSASTGTLNNFDVVTNDDSAVGSLVFQSAVAGDSDVVVDGGVTRLEYRDLSGTGSIRVGGDIATLVAANLLGGFVSADGITTITIGGNFGSTNAAITNEAGIEAYRAGSITIGGANRGRISIDREVERLAVSGITEVALARFGSLANFSTAGMSRTFVSVRDRLGPTSVNGDMFDSAILVGADLGTDATFGGTGRAADTVSAGFVGRITVTGNFRESDVAAGYLRGADGFFGTSDDTVSAGRSTIEAVVVGGTQVGSTRGSESYRVASSGSLGSVTVGGAAVTQAIGNFNTVAPLLAPAAIQVTDARVEPEAGVSIGRITFNQPIDFSSVSRALSISEVRGVGDVLIRLIEGVDYTLSAGDPQTILVRFSRALTSKDLPVVPGVPGPGIYRFSLTQSAFRAAQSGITIDGNGDGLADALEDWSEDLIVGDAGDKLTAETAFSGGRRVDFYAPINLDIVLDNNQRPDGLADANRTFTIRGSIGDHPDNDSNFFRLGGDTDVYSLTLQAGQILRLGALAGPAERAGLTLVDPSGNVIGVGATTATAISLPAPAAAQGDASQARAVLILQTGVYRLVVGQSATFNTAGSVSNPDTLPSTTGLYTFSLSVFDDGDSGFTATTDAGDGAPVVDAPRPIAFAGLDGVFGTADDRTTVGIGLSSFTLDRGPDGVPNTADDRVIGGNARGQTSVREGSGRVTTSIRAAIGPEGFAGVPGEIAADVDVFHLNNRAPIAPGTRIRLTVQLSGLGSDLGSASPLTLLDNRGAVKIAVFDTSDSTGVDDATLVFAPSDFLPYAGSGARTIADNGETRYGYDGQGDFFIEFLAPARLGGASTDAGTFAVMVQGVFNTDYILQVVTDGTGTTTRRTQNILIETGGGSVDWLEAGGLTTTLSPFNTSLLGFVGSALDGRPVQEFVLSELVAALNFAFNAGLPAGTGFDVRFSTNPADFEFQPFSTVYLSNAVDPITAGFTTFRGFNFDIFGDSFFGNNPYGYSQRSDPLNADPEDDAVVFVPSFALQGTGGTLQEASAFVQSLTGAVGRRVGELLGLRITSDAVTLPTGNDPLAANSPNVPRNADGSAVARSFLLSGVSRRLSGPLDSVDNTDFFLGRQNATSLLDRVLLRR